MLTIAFSFFNGDLDRGLRAIELIRDLRAGESHHCLLVCPEDTMRGEIEAVAREAFAAVDVLTYAATLKGWPQGPNEAFQCAAEHIAKNPNCGDFLWYETDCAITRSDAFTIAENTFRTCGHPILGNIVDTVQMDTRQAVGRHVVGVAVYPKMAAVLIKTIKSLTAMSSGYTRQNAVPMAFDAYIGPYTFQRTAEAHIFQHFWRSSEFTITAGVIKAGRTLGVENIVRPETVLIHGCKDASLLNIIREKHGLNEVRLLQKIEETIHPKEIKIDTSAPVPERIVAPTAKAPKPAKVFSTTAPPKDIPAKGESTRILESSKRGKNVEPVPLENWYRGENGLPTPPFLPGQAEYRRFAKLLTGRLQTGGFKKLRDYAKENLKINTKHMTAEAIIDACVMAERIVGKEEWTQYLPEPWFPPKEAPPAPPVVVDVAPVPVPEPPPAVPVQEWSTKPPAEPPQGEGLISPQMRQKMIELRQKREQQKVGA